MMTHAARSFYWKVAMAAAFFTCLFVIAGCSRPEIPESDLYKIVRHHYQTEKR